MLDITVEHAHAVGDLPAHHRDPFDMMLVAQGGTVSLKQIIDGCGIAKVS